MVNQPAVSNNFARDNEPVDLSGDWSPATMADWLENLCAEFHVPFAALEPADRSVFPPVRKGIVGSAKVHHPFLIHTNASDRPFVVSDARSDPRFGNSGPVKGYPGIRFYAGFPLIDQSGLQIGSLSILDTSPRKLSSENRDRLCEHVSQFMRAYETRPSPADDALPDTEPPAASPAKPLPKKEFATLPTEQIQIDHSGPADSATASSPPQAGEPPAQHSQPPPAPHEDPGPVACEAQPEDPVYSDEDDIPELQNEPSLIAKWSSATGEDREFLEILLDDFLRHIPPKVDFIRLLAEQGNFKAIIPVNRLVQQRADDLGFDAVSALCQSISLHAVEEDKEKLILALDYWNSAASFACTQLKGLLQNNRRAE